MYLNISEDFGIETRIARFHNVYGPLGTYTGSREKAPAAIFHKVVEAVIYGIYEIEIWVMENILGALCTSMNVSTES
jgi:GDP-D-mannose 3',5'-epimerase